MTPININSMASAKPTAFIKEVDMDKAMAAIIDIEDYEAIVKALVTVEEAFIEDLVEVDSIIKLDIDKRSVISIIRQNAS